MHSTVQSNAWTMVSQWKLRKLQSYLAIIVKLIWLRPLRARTETQISSSLRVTAVSASTSHNFCEACVRVVSTAAQIKVDVFFGVFLEILKVIVKMALSSQHTQVLIWIERFGLSCECEQTPSDAATHTLPALPLPGSWNGAQQLRIRQNVVKGQAQNNFLWNRANPFIGTATVQQKRQLSNTNRYKQLSFIIIFPYLLAWLMAVSLQWALSTFDLTLPQTSMSWTEKIWRQI